jgi:hypothetical protein
MCEEYVFTTTASPPLCRLGEFTVFGEELTERKVSTVPRIDVKRDYAGRISRDDSHVPPRPFSEPIRELPDIDRRVV